jgi:hypothetical protein
MGLIFRRSKRLDEDTDLNVSKSSASLSRRVGRRLRINSRGGGSVRLFKGMSWGSADAAE